MSFCPSCGKWHSAGMKFCTGCGAGLGEIAGPAKGAPIENAPSTIGSTHQFSSVRNHEARSVEIRKQLQKERKKAESGSSFLDNIQKQYPGPLIAITALMVIGIIAFTISNIRATSVEKPVQMKVVEGGVYYTTTRSLNFYNDEGVLIWRAEIAGNRPLMGLLNFDFSSDGTIYLSNPFGNSVDVFTPAGEWIYSFGENTFSSNFTLFVTSKDDVVVVDSKKHELRVFDSQGKELRKIGGRGTAKDEYRFPNGMIEMDDGTLWVSDTNNLRFARLDKDFSGIDPIRLEWKAINPGTKREGRVEIYEDGQETTVGAQNFPFRISRDTGRERVYAVIMENGIYPLGIIAVFDNYGNFISHQWLKSGVGESIGAESLTMNWDGTVSVVDTEHFAAGSWNPDTDAFIATTNSGVIASLTELKKKDHANKALYYAGLGSFAFCVIALCGLLGYASVVQKRHEEANYESFVTSGAICEPQSAPGSNVNNPVSDSTSFYMKSESTKKDVSIIILQFIALTVVFTVFIILLRYTRPRIALIYIVQCWMLGFFVVFSLVYKLQLKRGMWNFYFRSTSEQMLKKTARAFSEALLKDEKLISALPVGSNTDKSGTKMIYLTRHRIIMACDSSDGGLFVKKSQIAFRPLNEIKGVILKGMFILPQWRLVIELSSGKHTTFITSDFAEAKRFCEHTEELLKGKAPIPSSLSKNHIRQLCSGCLSELSEGKYYCDNCGRKFKNPKVASLLSTILSGLGQIYNGQYLQGAVNIVFSVVCASIIYMHFANLMVVDKLWMIAMVLTYIVMVIHSAITAYRDAHLIEA